MSSKKRSKFACLDQVNLSKALCYRWEFFLIYFPIYFPHLLRTSDVVMYKKSTCMYRELRRGHTNRFSHRFRSTCLLTLPQSCASCELTRPFFSRLSKLWNSESTLDVNLKCIVASESSQESEFVTQLFTAHFIWRNFPSPAINSAVRFCKHTSVISLLT